MPKPNTKTKNMKKILLAVGLLASTLTFGQSNNPGTIHVGLGWGLTLGGAKIDWTYTDAAGSESGSLKGIGAKSNYGLRFNYGLAESFSAGIFLRKESAVYAVTDPDGFDSYSLVTKGMAFGVEAKYYVVNKDKFNYYFAPSIGYSTGKAYDLDYAEETEKANGLNYGITTGFNWYWADFIGMSLDLGWSGGALKSSETEDGATWENKIKSGGVYFGMGLVSKFGGK